MRVWLLDGFAISGGSMAESLRGEHRAIDCEDCRFQFAVGTTPSPLDKRLVICPNCGASNAFPGPEFDVPGDSLLVDRSAFEWRSPRRFEIVVFRPSTADPRPYVKRVVGLPGESIALRHGDLYIDGEIVRKTLAQQRAIGILTHDDRHRPRSNFKSTSRPTSRRWRVAPLSGWRETPKGFYYAPSETPSGAPGNSESQAGQDSEFEWLTYHHGRLVSNSEAPLDERPVDDLQFYNQTRSTTVTHLAPDLLLSCRARFSPSSRAIFVARDGRETFEIRIEPGAGRLEIWRDAKRMGQAELDASTFAPPKSSPAWRVIEVSLFDRRCLFAVDGQTLLSADFRSLDPPDDPTTTPFAIGGADGDLSVTDLRIYRDVVYVSRMSESASRSSKSIILGKDQFFVLGDNTQVSLDSRDWPTEAVTTENLLGKPIFRHIPRRKSVFWNRIWTLLDVERFGAIR